MESRDSKSLTWIRWGTWSFLLAFVVFAFLYPLYALFAKAKPIDVEVWGLAWNSTKQALCSTALSVFFGTGFGLFLHRFSLAPKQRSLLLIPFSLPAMVTAQVTLGFFDLGYGAVLFAHALLNTPWVAWIVTESLAQYPSSLQQAAQTLGSTRKKMIQDFYVPYLLPSLYSAALQVFCVCLMSFTIVLLLGGGPPVSTLETEIFASIRLSGFDIDRALSCALIQFTIVLVPTLLNVYFQRKDQTTWGALRVESRERGPTTKWVAFLPLLLVLPYVCLFLMDPALWDKAGWIKLLSKTQFWYSLMFSLALAVSCGVLVVLVSFGAVLLSRPLAHFISLWSGVSALVLSLAFFMAYAEWLDLFEGSFFAMVILQSLVLLPIAVRIVLPLQAKKQTHLLSVAQSMGASEIQAWWSVEWPRWRGILIMVFTLTLVFSLGETAAVSFFASEKLQTFSLFTGQSLAKYKFEEATRLLFILFVLSVSFLKIGGHYEERK